jgi:hypothetical protein
MLSLELNQSITFFRFHLATREVVRRTQQNQPTQNFSYPTITTAEEDSTRGSTKEVSLTRGSTRASTKEASPTRDSTRADSTRVSIREDSTREVSTREVSTREVSTKEDSTKEDSTRGSIRTVRVNALASHLLEILESRRETVGLRTTQVKPI